MQTDFTVTTVYDQAAYIALVNLMMNKLRRWPRMIILATGFVSVVGSGMLMLTQGSVSAGPFLVMMLGSMMCMLGFFAPRFAVRMMMASNKKGPAPENTYLFSRDGMRIQNGATQKDYTYAFMNRLLEMSGYLFLFMKDGQVYMLRQTDVKGGYSRLHQYLEECLTAERKTA